MGTVMTTSLISPATSFRSAKSSPLTLLLRSLLTARAKLCHQHSSGVKWVLYTTNFTRSPEGATSGLSEVK